MSAEPHLRLAETGEIPEDAPSYSEALTLVQQLDQQIRMMERDLAGKRLRIADLEADREAQALADPTRPVVELIHAVWKTACKRRRPLHFADYERIGRALRKLGLSTCLAAVAGAAYDPAKSKPQRNGRCETYNDLELVFREHSKTKAFARRAPNGWQPDLERVAAIANVSVKAVERWMEKVA